MSTGLDFERIKRERPERLEREDVLATPAGGAVGILHEPREPVSVVVSDRIPVLLYLRWDDDGDVAYWRDDVFMERFGAEAMRTRAKGV